MKNLRMRVREDGSVHVSAPYGVSRAAVDAFVESRAEWIKQRRSELPETCSDIRDGGAVTIFGERLSISVIKGCGGCREENGRLIISAADPENAARLEETVMFYMAERCRDVLEEAFRRFLVISGYSGTRPALRLKLMKSRWGSCNRSENVITLNLMLCKLPERFSYYVAAHEVAHLFIPDHSEAFYALGEKLYPDFRKTDRELNRVKVGALLS